MSMPGTLGRFFAALHALRPIGGSREGGTAIEYALIAALVAVAIVGALGDVRDALIGLPLSSLIDAFADALS